MGLSISYDTWEGGYRSFHKWRTIIAKYAGLPPLDLMEGFYSKDNNTHSINMANDYCAIGNKDILNSITDTLPIKWSCLKKSPLHKLLYHSDCDGKISKRECASIAKALEKLLPLLPNEDFGWHIGNFIDKTKTFIAGLRLAVSNNSGVKFR